MGEEAATPGARVTRPAAPPVPPLSGHDRSPLYLYYEAKVNIVCRRTPLDTPVFGR
jgi:hypothetical protein